MNLSKLAAVAGLCLFAAAIVLIGMPIEAHAAGVSAGKSVAAHYGDIGLVAAQLVLATGIDNLRAQRDELTRKADAIMAEMRDGLSATEISEIEARHRNALADIKTVKDAIATEETRAAASPAAPAAPAVDHSARAADINDIGTRAGMPREAIDVAMRDSAVTVEAFRARAFEHMATRAAAAPASGINVQRDETETRRINMTDAIIARVAGVESLGQDDRGNRRVLSAGARSYMDFSFADLAAEVVGTRQRLSNAAVREDVLRRAFHTTSDFPIIFEGAINRVLAARYELQAPTYRAIAARRKFKDFRPHSVIRVGDFPMLKPVPESGEIKFGTWGESKETISVAPYAVQFAITRHMLVNDDIGAIDQMLGSYGQSVADFENVTFYSMKAVGSGAGPVLLTDNKRVFHTDHGNLAQTPAAIDTDSLSIGRAAMRKQKNMDGKALNAVPTIMLVGPDKETEADMAVAVITPTEAGNVNPFSGKLKVTTEALIEGNAWELYADPARLPVFQWGLLDGYGAPRMRIENPFGVQGVGVSLEHDFGCGAIDYRGAFRNTGA